MDDPKDIRIGVSSCLLGEQVRYDGGHRKNDCIVNVLGQLFTWVPVCPEFEIGMGVPRETLHLIGNPESPRMVTTETGVDYTNRMLAFARDRVRQLEAMDLSGYILKSNSPSCGMEGVKIYSEDGTLSGSGRGLFARVLTEHFPHMPAVEEERLSDPAFRENFIERVFCFHRRRRLTEGRGAAPHPPPLP